MNHFSDFWALESVSPLHTSMDEPLDLLEPLAGDSAEKHAAELEWLRGVIGKLTAALQQYMFNAAQLSLQALRYSASWALYHAHFVTVFVGLVPCPLCHSLRGFCTIPAIP